MPDLDTVKSAVAMVARTMSRQCSARDLDLVARDMAQHPRDYGAWDGPNWDESYLRSELAQRLWNLPDHPSRIPREFIGLPFKTLRDVMSPNYGYGIDLDPEERHEWLSSIACNRRCGGTEWKAWLDNPERWRLRHVEDGAFARIQQWQTEAA